MALILDESFLTGIPGSFATARAQVGALTVAYNAGAQAVDLSNPTAGQNIWDITSVPLSVSGEMEIDLEFVSNAAGVLGFGGAWPVAAQAAVSNGFRFAHNATAYENFSWTGATSWAGNSVVDSFPQSGLFPFATAGDRRVFNVRWDMTAGAGSARASAEFRIDGNLILRSLVTFPSLRPGVTLFQSTVRLHGIKVWDAPQAPTTTLSGRGLDAAVSRRICAPPEAMVSGGPRNISRGAVLGWRNAYQGGGGRVVGTVKEKNLPANTPLRRRVQLIDEGTRLLVRESWSDATTGAYSFDYVDMARKYTVMSYDHTGAYRAVVADGQIPELIV